MPGPPAHRLITRQVLMGLKDGAVVVGLAIDHGRCSKTRRPTTHRDPIYKIMGVENNNVASRPGALPRTSIFALTNATLPFVISLADQGYPHTIVHDDHLRNGMNVHRGCLTHPAVARDRRYK